MERKPPEVSTGFSRREFLRGVGATSVAAYRDFGYIPAGLVNFLALLGWSPEGAEAEEVLSVEELIAQFSLEKVKSGREIKEGRPLKS